MNNQGHYMLDLKIFSDGVSLLIPVVSTVKSVIDILPKRKKEDASQKLHEIGSYRLMACLL